MTLHDCQIDEAKSDTAAVRGAIAALSSAVKNRSVTGGEASANRTLCGLVDEWFGVLEPETGGSVMRLVEFDADVPPP